jgi:nucleoside-diphosphate-sugar epimerase
MTARTVLVTGATGFLGSHGAAALLGDPTVDLVAPARAHHGPTAVVDAIASAVGDAALPPGWRARVRQVALGGDGDPFAALDTAIPGRVDEVLHCAGCLSYSDTDQLQAVNVELTTALLRAAERWGADRFVHVSTAFAGGYPTPGAEIPERLHADAALDPTPYTASKRQAEAVVAAGAVPWLILRPSIVIGESTSGRYCGPSYGLYQLWSGLERFLLDEWAPEVHFVAPAHPLPLLHQDAFRAALLGARAQLPPGTIVHLSSQPSPDVADVASLFLRDHLRPGRVVLHDRIDAVDRAQLSRANRMLLRLASVNLDIAGHDWRFESAAVDRLVRAGTRFPDADLRTVERCQDAFFGASPRLRRYVEANASRFPAHTEVIRA